MNADIQGALEQLNKSYRVFEHRGQRMTKQQVKTVLQYGLKKGYAHTGQLSDEEVDAVLSGQRKTGRVYCGGCAISEDGECDFHCQ